MPRTPIRTPIASAPHAFLTELGAARLHVRRVLEQSEARFRQMADAVPELLWFESLEPASMLYVSPGYEEIWVGGVCG